MLDLKWIRKNQDEFKAHLQRRNASSLYDQILELDHQWRESLSQLQELQAHRNFASKPQSSQPQEEQDLKRTSSSVVEEKKLLLQMEHKTKHIKEELDSTLSYIPNILESWVPSGKDETDNLLIKTWGHKTQFSFQPKSHHLLGKELKQMDFETTAQISGARFVTLTSDLACLERALINFMMDLHIQNGYTEISPPYLVNESAVYGVGQLPKFKKDLFVTTEGKWLISTGEVSLTNMVAHKVLKEEDLPLLYAACTPCFRSEAGAAGKDTRGMIRLHQFLKVELVHITTPEQSDQEYEKLCLGAEQVLQLLKLPYRVVLLCEGDMGFAASQTKDIEVWFPGENNYREISSCSHFKDFQARRMKARFKRNQSKELVHVHTLNGSALPIGRTLAAILENYQLSDGSIMIPEVLRSYMKGQEKIMCHFEYV